MNRRKIQKEMVAESMNDDFSSHLSAAIGCLVRETVKEVVAEMEEQRMEACREMKSQIKELKGISDDVKHVVADINLIRNLQTEMRSEIMKRINETSTDFYCQDLKIVIFLILILFCIISIIIFEMLY